MKTNITNRVLIVSDIHIPFQDQRAVDVALEIKAKYKPDTVVLNGDIMDCMALSRFSKDPMAPEAFKDELDEACDLIAKFQRRSAVTMVEGNHEARFCKFLQDRAPELFGLMTMEELINDRLRTPIEYVHTAAKESMLELTPDLIVGHMNLARKNSGYTAKALVEKYRKNIIQGHTHRLAHYTVRLYDTILHGYEMGCLCDLNPEYVLKPDWAQGFCMFEQFPDRWNVELIQIHDGMAIYRGKEYTGGV